MKPSRPDSAKSALTKKTKDSQDVSIKQLNGSKFSETYSVGVNLNQQKNVLNFEKYVAQKNKEPKFKKYANEDLAQIPQKKYQIPSNKISNKPFEKKVLKGQKKIIEQQIKRNQINEESKNKKQINPKRFATRNKQKMNMLIKTQKKKENEINKQKINFNTFKLNTVQQSKIKTKQKQKKQQQQFKQFSQQQIKIKNIKQNNNKNNNSNKNKQQIQLQNNISLRQQQLLQLLQYVNKIEIKNKNYYPQRFQEFIQNNNSNHIQLNKIDINKFLQQEITIQQYQQVERKIKEMDYQLQNNKIIEINENSINLDELIKTEQQDSQDILSYISSQQLKQRNIFLTDILKGNKIKLQDIQKLKEMDQSIVKMIKLEQSRISQQQEEQEQIQLSNGNRNNKRIIQRNKIQARGAVYRDCDYLSQQNKERLDQLLNGELPQSPYKYEQIQQLRNRRIEEGIKMYRQLSLTLDSNQEIIIINKSVLPKDIILRKEAERKILKDKLNDVNNRLRNINKIVINDTKINLLIERYQYTQLSQASSNILIQNEKYNQSINSMIQEAKKIIIQAEKDKCNIDCTMDQIQKVFRDVQKEILAIRQMDNETLYQYEKAQLINKKQQLMQINNKNEQLQNDAKQLQQDYSQLQQQLKQYNKIQQINKQTIIIQGYQEGQTIDQIDKMLIKKYQIST